MQAVADIYQVEMLQLAASDSVRSKEDDTPVH